MADESLSESELDQLRRLVKNDAALQADIKAASRELYDRLRSLPLYQDIDSRGWHRAIRRPVVFEARGVPFALNPLHECQLWRGFQIVISDERGEFDRTLVLATHRPDDDFWAVKEPGLEAELAKKIVGRSRLYYYPDGDSKTRVHVDVGKGTRRRDVSETRTEKRDRTRRERLAREAEAYGLGEQE